MDTTWEGSVLGRARFVSAPVSPSTETEASLKDACFVVPRLAVSA